MSNKANHSRTKLSVTDTSGIADDYVLEEQVGFIIRQVGQRHAAIFSKHIGESLTPTQFSTLLKLDEVGSCSQNLLGRYTAMDAATIKGVIDRLKKCNYVLTIPDPTDKRRLLVKLSTKGKRRINKAIGNAIDITARTLKPLSAPEQRVLLRLLKKLT